MGIEKFIRIFEIASCGRCENLWIAWASEFAEFQADIHASSGIPGSNQTPVARVARGAQALRRLAGTQQVDASYMAVKQHCEVKVVEIRVNVRHLHRVVRPDLKIMKKLFLFTIAALVLFAAVGCDKQSPAVEKKIAELVQKSHEAADRQRELEQELQDQELAAERDSIERERVRIGDDRAELEHQQGVVAAEQDEALREREQALSSREGMLDQFQSSLDEKEDNFEERSQQLSERDRELAGREALSFEEPALSAPTADFGMFYDSLSSYGSWFDTADYGYVWQPVVVSDSNWRPYSRGRWVCSDRGWTWVSEEPFGWATYHYGRWALLRDRGWIWVPGAEWAPCWVSWRENGSHIGWAPLPPETLAYRGHNWDSSVDVQFGIGALCYNFVETRHFGSSLSGHCLPISANGRFFQKTSNITYIHIENRQVICGGPKYKKVSEGVGRSLPFYRLEIDHHPRPSRDSLGMRPRIKGDRLMVSAPNMDVAWNDGLKPKRIKDRLELVTVERNGNLSREITDRYRKSRDEGRQKSAASIAESGEAEQILPDNRHLAEGKEDQEVARIVAKNREHPQGDHPGVRETNRAMQPAEPDSGKDQVPAGIDRLPNVNRLQPAVVDDWRNPVVKDPQRVAPTEAARSTPEPRPQLSENDRRVARTNDSVKQVENQRERQRQANAGSTARNDAVNRRQEEQAPVAQRRQNQTEAEQAREAQKEEQAQQRQLDMQRDAEQAREAQREAKRQREQRQQQELAQQREQERVQRQQQEDQQRQQQQRDMQRQQEDAQQRQEEQSRRRQQENQRQRQQEDSRQKQEKDQKDQDEPRKRGR